MEIRLCLGAPAFRQRKEGGSRQLAMAVQAACLALTTANRIIIRNRLVPPLYKSGVRYREEDERPWECFDDAWVCTQRKWGDCDDLASWRLAELLEAGERGEWRNKQGQLIQTPCIRISWKPHPTRGGRLYHVTVRRANGQIEDPSLNLGMKIAV